MPRAAAREQKLSCKRIWASGPASVTLGFHWSSRPSSCAASFPACPVFAFTPASKEDGSPKRHDSWRRPKRLIGECDAVGGAAGKNTHQALLAGYDMAVLWACST